MKLPNRLRKALEKFGSNKREFLVLSKIPATKRGLEDLETLTRLKDQGIECNTDDSRKQGAATERNKAETRKKAFIEIYLEEREKDPKATKEGNLLSAMQRFKYRHGKISERTAWKYLNGID